MEEHNGRIWIERELAPSAERIALHTAGVTRVFTEKGRGSIVLMRYYYADPHLKEVIAHEIYRQVRVLTGR